MAFTIINEWVKTNKKFSVTQHAVEFQLNKPSEPLEDPEQWLKDGLRAIYDCVTENLKSDNRVGLTLSSELLQYDVHNPMTEMRNVNFDRLWDMLHKLYQSNTEASEGDTLKLIVTSRPNSKELQGSGIDQATQGTSLPEAEIHGSGFDQGSMPPEAEVQEAEIKEPEVQDDKASECTECLCKYSHTGRGLCDKCYIKGGHCKKRFIPYSPHSWSSYDEFKQWQRIYDRKMVKCDICEKEMIRTSLYHHKAKRH